MEEVINIESITALHNILSLGNPKHPLITLLDASKLEIPKNAVGNKVTYDLYMISIKDKSCGAEYGRSSIDYDEGVLFASSPKQIYTQTKAVAPGDIKGWILYFHPDLVRGTHLGEIINDYSFFNYKVFEGLHLSEEEEKVINDCINNIKKEYEQRIDNHSHRVIVSSLELLLNYILRFYERQFNTRTSTSSNVVGQFKSELKKYFTDKKALENGLPLIEYFSNKANLSQHYFSDLIKKETGRTPKDHINNFVVEMAKNLLLSSEQSISEIAYDLGFNYPHYFTRLFKSKTGHTPVEYRSLN